MTLFILLSESFQYAVTGLEDTSAAVNLTDNSSHPIGTLERDCGEQWAYVKFMVEHLLVKYESSDGFSLQKGTVLIFDLRFHLHQEAATYDFFGVDTPYTPCGLLNSAPYHWSFIKIAEAFGLRVMANIISVIISLRSESAVRHLMVEIPPPAMPKTVYSIYDVELSEDRCVDTRIYSAENAMQLSAAVKSPKRSNDLFPYKGSICGMLASTSLPAVAIAVLERTSTTANIEYLYFDTREEEVRSLGVLIDKTNLHEDKSYTDDGVPYNSRGAWALYRLFVN